MTHSRSTWVFITLASGVHVVMDVDLEDTGIVLAESSMFDDQGQELEEVPQ